MAGFVGDDAFELVRIGRLDDQAGIDEDRLAVDREGVQILVAHEDQGRVLGDEARRPQDRIGVDVQRLLDLGVADQIDPAFLGPGDAGREGEVERKGGEGCAAQRGGAGAKRPGVTRR